MTTCTTSTSAPFRNSLLAVWHSAFAQGTAKKCPLYMKSSCHPPSVDEQAVLLPGKKTPQFQELPDCVTYLHISTTWKQYKKPVTTVKKYACQNIVAFSFLLSKKPDVCGNHVLVLKGQIGVFIACESCLQFLMKVLNQAFIC